MDINQIRQDQLSTSGIEQPLADVASPPAIVEAVRLLFGGQPGSVLMLDPAGKLVFANQPARAGIAAGADGALVTTAEEIQPPAVAARLLALLNDLTGEQPPAAGGVVVGEGPDGILTAWVLVDATGAPAGLLVLNSSSGNSSDHGRMEEIGRLAGFMAHDFNNMLGGILGNASLACNSLAEDHPAWANFKAVETAAQRAAELAQQVMAYTGSRTVSRRAVDLNAVVREMSRLLEVSIARKAEISYTYHASLPSILADVNQVRQVVLNLIANAAEAVDDAAGKIAISTGVEDCTNSTFSGCMLYANCRPGAYAWIEVGDNGCGISPEAAGKIFDPFFTTKATGHGIGLAAVKGAVIQHSAALRLVSSPGSTAFRVYFPAATDGIAPAPREQRTIEPDSAASGTVLIADDEEVIRLVAQQALEEKGFKTLLAVDGVEAVEIFNAAPDAVNLLLLDVAMPRLNGPQVLEEVRKTRPGIKAIMSSGFNEQEAAKHYKLASGILFLQKPYLPASLVAKVRQALTE